MNKVYFSTVWEDYISLKSALHPSNKDTILTISSSGDNVFNLLSDKVKKIIAVDFNPAQLNIAKLKLSIICKYDRNQAIELLEGIGNKGKNIKLIQDIIILDKEFRKYLSDYNFSKGVDNIGEFDTKVIPILRFFIRRFFEFDDFGKSDDSGRGISIWFKILLLLFSKKSLYRFLLPDFPYKHINVDIKNSLTNSLVNFLRFNDFSKNWYLQKVYYGKYKLMPPFLKENKFCFVKNNASKIEFVQGDILNHLKKSENQSIDKINYSDIFDWCSAKQFTNILKESHRVLSNQGIIFYRELFVSRKIPEDIFNKFEILKGKVSQIHKRDNTPLYHKIVILKKR